MKQELKNAYVEVLKNIPRVCFWSGEYFFVIEDHSEGGWNVDVYTNDDGGFFSDDKHELVLVDGGHCESDNEIDAIEFMLDVAEAV